MIVLLNQKINDIENDLKLSALDYEKYEKEIIMETDLNQLEIINCRLEVLIEMLKTPNFIILKRKIIEVLLFELYKKKKEKFGLPQYYMPSKINLEELGKLMNKKINEKYHNNTKILNDINQLNQWKDKINQKDKEKEKEDKTINQTKSSSQANYDKFDIVKRFLEFYKKNYTLLLISILIKVNIFLYLDYSKMMSKKHNIYGILILWFKLKIKKKILFSIIKINLKIYIIIYINRIKI